MLRRDHVAGGVFVAAGVVVLAASGDLPFGTLASPGAGMLPMLVTGLMIAFGVILVAGAGSSPPVGTIGWADLPHAARVVGVMVGGVAVYTTLGFLVTMPVMLFCLLFVIERRRLLPALAFSAGVPLATHLLFEYLLKSPLERGLLRF